MMTPMRYVILVLAIIVRYCLAKCVLCGSFAFAQISLHFILSFSHEEYGRATSITHLKEQLQGSGQMGPAPATDYSSNPERANATFVLLARNSDLKGIVTSVKQNGASSECWRDAQLLKAPRTEDRFNKEFKYPYVFLNEEPFSDEFKK